MAKKKVDIQKEVAKIWQEAKENLRALGQKTMKLAQKGEVEVMRASRIGKLQLDIVSVNLKKENAKLDEKYSKQGKRPTGETYKKVRYFQDQFDDDEPEEKTTAKTSKKKSSKSKKSKKKKRKSHPDDSWDGMDF